MSRAVEILTLQQFEAAGGLADGYAFEDFSCPLNEEIEKFLREKAVQSTHLGSSVTYLVYDKQTSALLGYFTLMLKPFSIAKSMISKTKCRMLERLAREDKGNFTAAVYLIAQIGKNFALDEKSQNRGLRKMVRYQTLKEARVTDDRHVAVVFDNGERGIFDCAPYFGQSYWSKLREPSFFKQAYVEYGHLTWPGDIDISPIEVWQDAKRERVV